MGYQYRGKLRDVSEETPETPQAPQSDEAQAEVFDPSKCGTIPGHKQHIKLGVPTCRPCKDVINAYRREWRARREAGLLVREFRDDKCGTLAGYSRHVRHDVPLCDACRAARSEYRSAYWAERAA